MPKECSITGCGSPAVARGFCPKHWRRWRNHGDPLVSLYNRDHGGRCSRKGCARPYYAKGLCQRHYEQALHAKRRAQPSTTSDSCWADGCNEPPNVETGLCPEHQRIADDWNTEMEEALVICCVKDCAETIEPETFGWDFPCCSEHLRAVTYAMELEEWGVMKDALGYLDCPDWLAAKWIAAILGRKRESRQYLDKVTGDTPLFKVVTSTVGDLYPLLPTLTARRGRRAPRDR